jgi:hypothetical protein
MSRSTSIEMLEALSRAFHRAAEERMPHFTPFADERAARVLGSCAQAFQWAAEDLHEQQRQLERAPGDIPRPHYAQRHRRPGPLDLGPGMR